MIYHNQFYCIYYNDNDNTYITDLIESINSNLKRIMEFFGLEDFVEKKTITIWQDLMEYKQHVKQYVKEYQDWMVADTFDNNINILSFSLFLAGPHKNSTISDYCKIIVHEFVHSCQQEINPVADNIEWFWEALATNLSNQNMNIINITYSKEDILHNFFKLSDAYSVAYTIGQYMLQHFSSSEIVEYVKNPKALIDDTDFILEKTKLMI